MNLMYAVYLVAMCSELLPSSSMAPASAPASTSSITWNSDIIGDIITNTFRILLENIMYEYTQEDDIDEYIGGDYWRISYT